ncbi:TPA: hypothetical protein N3F75_004316, partial [Klebsiella aerogenes]|nr:hypothetical protein [Klebsiella aerogenes]
MTDITELAQEARINAGCGEYLSPAETMELVEALEKAQQLETQASEMAVQLSTRLTAAEKRATELDAELEREREKSRRVMSRIAELESRTVTVKFSPIPVEELGNVRDGKKHPYMFGAGYNSAVIHCESVIQQELDA